MIIYRNSSLDIISQLFHNLGVIILADLIKILASFPVY